MRHFVPFLLCCLASCGIHQADPIGSAATRPPPETADAADASTNCFESVTAVEKAVCATPALAAPNRAMVQALQADLGDADIFLRDALLASQRVWLLGLDGQCHAPALDTLCLAQALSSRAQTLRAGHRAPAKNAALAQYVAFRPAGTTRGADAAFCTAFGLLADRALAAGDLDPAAMGATEIAGSHGAPPSGQHAGRVAVELHQANVYGLYQRRARAVRIDGRVVLDPLSLTLLVHANSSNSGGRLSAYASQTGDYGSMDVFRLYDRTLALIADTWGSGTPAAPGEFGHAGLWDVGTGTPVPLCLFDIYQMPAVPGVFAGLAKFAAWREALSRIHDSASLPLGTAMLRDESQLRADADFLLLDMPLFILQQAKSGGWAPWLRKRHDDVLDALSVWSHAAAANKPMFDDVFAGLRGAAQDLVRAYQQTQGLDAAEATQAAGLTMMELLYAATVTIAPSAGADVRAPADAVGYRPRYPILASPN